MKPFRVFMRGSGGGAVATTWNPSDKSSLILLSDGNLTATKSTSSGTWGSVRATNAKATGKWYFEVLVSSTSGNNSDLSVGLINGSGSITDMIGNAANGYCYYGFNGNKYNNTSGVAFGSTYTASDVVGVAYDADAGKIWFAKNNTWQASGNPAAGTNAAYSSAPASLYPAVSEYWNGEVMVARFASASQTYSPPSGFTAWG